MLKLNVLCVLLPLVAGTLDSCDQAGITALLADKPLPGKLQDNFPDTEWWIAFVGKEGAGKSQSVEISISEAKDSKSTANFIYRDCEGNTINSEERTYTWCENHVSTPSESSGPKFGAWARLDKTEEDIAGEVEDCMAKFTKALGSVDYIRRTHPSVTTTCDE